MGFLEGIYRIKVSLYHLTKTVKRIFHLIRGQVPLWVVHILAGLHILSGVDAGGKTLKLLICSPKDYSGNAIRGRENMQCFEIYESSMRPRDYSLLSIIHKYLQATMQLLCLVILPQEMQAM